MISPANQCLLVFADRNRAIENKKARDTATHNKLLDLGVHGDTPFMHLPGANWADFSCPGTPHAVLLGVWKDVTTMLNMENKEKLSDGNEYMLRNPPNSRQQPMQDRMLDEVRNLRTSHYKRVLENVLACDSTARVIIYCTICFVHERWSFLRASLLPSVCFIHAARS